MGKSIIKRIVKLFNIPTTAPTLGLADVRKAFCNDYGKVKPSYGKTLKFEDYCELVSKGAVFYLGHDIPIFNPSVVLENRCGLVRLDKYECCKNGSVFYYSLPPHTHKIKIEHTQ